MTFTEARATSKLGFHVRRAAWTDFWFIDWRGVWFYDNGTIVRPVEATDYTDLDLTASDWTTMPAPLAACKVDDPPGSTGGGSFPPPGPPSGGGGGPTPPPGPPPPGGGGPTPTPPPWPGPIPGPWPPAPPGPTDPHDPKPPKPPSTCTFGSASLTALMDPETGIVGVELDVTGASAGTYSVRYTCMTVNHLGGTHSGPNFTDSTEITIDPAFAFSTVTINAVITGFSGGPCKGMQFTASTDIAYFPLTFCPTTDRAISVSVAITPKTGHEHEPIPGGATCRWNGTEWYGRSTHPRHGSPAEVTFEYHVLCGGVYGTPVGLYCSVVGDLHGTVGGNATGGVGNTVVLDGGSEYNAGTATISVVPRR